MINAVPSLMPTEEAKGLMTTRDAAVYLGLSVSTLNKWRCLSGGPKFTRLGRAIRYERADLDQFVSNSRYASTSAY